MTNAENVTIIEGDSFSHFSPEQIKALENAIQTADRNYYISQMDYQKGTISVGLINNAGTQYEFKTDDFIVVNVACDSIAAAFYDVYTRAYKRAM